jgi:glutamate 5-kinase
MNFPSKIVVKVGTNVVSRERTNGDPNRLDVNVLRDLSAEISSVMKQTGGRIILVSSGAVAAGREVVQLDPEIDRISRKQVLAAIGQPRLMREYSQAFLNANPARKIAQILVTRDNFERESERQNILRTLQILPHEVVPIVNENDTVATEELTLGDNDQLAARIAELVRADLLILFTDVDGVFDKNPAMHSDAKLIPELHAELVTENFVRKIGLGKSTNGTGGMESKLRAAAKAAMSGIQAVIAHGKNDGNLRKIVTGEPVGTRIIPVA